MGTEPRPSPLVELADGIWALPILHGRLESAMVVALAMDMLQPQHVCVELPVTFQDAVIEAIKRLPKLSLVQAPVPEAMGNFRYLLVEPAEAMVEALRLALGRQIPVHCVDADLDEYPEVREPWPDPYVATRIGHGRYCAEILKHLAPSELPEDQVREQAMAHRCQALLARASPATQGETASVSGRVLLVCGIRHVPGLQVALQDPQPLPLGRVRRDDLRVFHLHPDSAREILSEMAFLQKAWEEARPRSIDRLSVHLDLCRRANDRYEIEDKSRVTTLQIKALLQYARNLVLAHGMLVPGVFDLLLAARGVADDDFAWWFWQTATTWPWQEEKAEIPTLRIGLQDLHKGARTFHFHRRQKGLELLRSIGPRLREAPPVDQTDSGRYTCSHPPEDIVLEGYAAFLRQRTVGILAAEQSRIEPFTTSMLDGIDIRETLRNMAHDGRLYVREDRPVRGKVGSVVLIFDPDDAKEGERYPFHMTWQGEHDEESDMAFYATQPGVQLVGPGISKCEYGGFVMTWPPGRMFQVWEQEVFQGWPKKAERMLLAGILYSPERLVAYIARKPPRAMLRSIAHRFGKKLVYIPLGQLSPVTLKRIKSFHLLRGKFVRSWAGEYIR